MRFLGCAVFAAVSGLGFAVRPDVVVFVGDKAELQVAGTNPSLTFKPLGSTASLVFNGTFAAFIADKVGRFVVDNATAVDAIPKASSGTAPAPWLASALLSSSWMDSDVTASDTRPQAWSPAVNGDCNFVAGTGELSVRAGSSACDAAYLVSLDVWSPFRGGASLSVGVPAPGAGGTIVAGFSASRESLTRAGTTRFDPFAPSHSCWMSAPTSESAFPGVCASSIAIGVNDTTVALYAPAAAGSQAVAPGLVMLASAPRAPCGAATLSLTVNGSAASVSTTCASGGSAKVLLAAAHRVNWQTFGANATAVAAQPENRPFLWDAAYEGESAAFVGLVPAQTDRSTSNGSLSMGKVTVAWADAISVQGRLPAVMLPVGDETGVYSETDIGTAQDAPTDLPRRNEHDSKAASRHLGAESVTNWFGASGGILDASLPPFNADTTGATDATAAIQSAVEFARANYMVVWLPAGDYKVTSTIAMQQTARLSADGSPAFNFTTNYCWTRFVPNVLVGAANDPSGRRARLVVPASTAAFSDASSPQAVVYFHTINADGQTQSNINMGQGLISVDIVVGAGNDGAIGVHLRSAQGSSLEDVTVDMTEGGLTGIEGLPGSGGSDSHVTVLGGRWGIDARTTQPSATLTAATLIGQTCTALLHEGSETLTAVGLNVTLAAGAAGPAIVTAGDITASMVGCTLPATAAIPGSSVARRVKESPHIVSGSQAHSGQLSLVDSVVDASAAKFGVALLAQASLVLSGAYFTGAPVAVRVLPMRNASQAFELNTTGGWVAADLAAFSDNAPSDGHYEYDTAGFVDGVRVLQSPAVLSVRTGNAAVAGPPAGLTQSHHWGSDGNSLVFDAVGAFSVKDKPYNAVGDGYHDDTAAILAAIADAGESIRQRVRVPSDAANTPLQAVFVPRGVYRVSQTIVVPPGVALIGAAKHLSVLTPAPGGLTGSVPLPGDLPAAVIHVAGSAVLPPAAVAFLSVTVPEHLANVSALVFEAPGRVHTMAPPCNASSSCSSVNSCSDSGARASTSTAAIQPRRGGTQHTPDSVHRRSLYRNSWQHRWNFCGSTWDERCSAADAQAPLLESPMVVIAGVGGFGLPPIAFYTFFLEDFRLEGPGARHLLVLNATAGGELPPAVSTPAFGCYHCNTEHGRGDAMLEVTASAGVRLFGVKSEGNFNVLAITRSSNVSMYGYGGNAAAFPLKQGYPTGYKQYTPSLFRVENSFGIFLGNINGQPRYGGPIEPCGFPGCAYDPADWSMVAVFNNSLNAKALTPPLSRPAVFASSDLI